MAAAEAHEPSAREVCSCYPQVQVEGFSGLVRDFVVSRGGKAMVRGLRARYDRHARLARWTWPIWMYVSVTGVIVYLMLYQMY